MHPKRIDSPAALQTALVVHGVLVEQHLHFTLQALQSFGALMLWHPWFDVLADNTVNAGQGQTIQEITFDAPNQGAFIDHLKPIFLKVGLYSGQELL